MIMMNDNELALVCLRDGVIQKLDKEVLVEKPPNGESQSIGAMENAVKLVKGMLRTLLMALERR